MSHTAYSLPASAYEALGLSDDVVRIATTPRPKPPTIVSPNILQDTDALEPEQRLAMNESSITLYAELLLHIRTVTLFASLRSVHTRETKARLESEGCAITVTHEGASATLRLPIQVEGGGDASLSLPAMPPSKEITLRLQIEEREGSNMLGALLAEERKANIVPWGGVTLSAAEEVTIHCATCHAVVVSKGTVREWRDLPNENWAEMMDFWHCHKPDEHHLHDHAQEEAIGQKAYAAGNRLQATAGVGFVDLGSFLLDAEDCEGIETSATALHCSKCNHILGAPDPTASGHRLWKWCTAISQLPPPAPSESSQAPAPPSSTPPPPPVPISFAPQKWLSARLLSLIENHNVRRFHIHAPPPFPSSSSPSSSAPSPPTPSLLLWIFTPDLFFSSSLSPRGPTRAMKVFWKRQTWAAPVAGDVEKADEEDVEVVRKLYVELEAALERSRGWLPGQARRWKGWEVGLLERFDVGEVGVGDGGVGDGGEEGGREEEEEEEEERGRKREREREREYGEEVD